MHRLDWVVIATYAALSVGFAFWFAHKKAHATGADYMVAGRRLPWWIVGIADVTTGDGGDAYWIYIFFAGGLIAYYRFFWISAVLSLPLGVLWARYWRRLALSSPGQLFEERYGGPTAARFRAFSSVYGALVPNGILLGYILQGFAQSLVPFLGWRPELVLLLFCGSTLLYTLLSGLLAVAYSDIVQFLLIMTARIVLAAILLSAAGGLGHVLDRIQQVRGPDFLQPYPPATAAHAGLYGPFSVDPLSMIALLIAGLFGASIGTSAGGTAVQRALAAKNEMHAAVGQVFNTVLSLLVRTVPMILVGLVAVATFAPGRQDTNIWSDLVRAHAPPGLLGLLLVGIIAGYMSTLDGLLNFSAAGMLNDVYRRFIRPDASDAQQVLFGRIATLVVMATAALWALVLIKHIDAAWINFINSVTGTFILPLALLRWVWWRMNIYGEVAGFVISFPLTYLVWFGMPSLFPTLPAFKDRPYWQSFAILFGLGWLIILGVTLCTQPESPEVLRRFYLKVRPPGVWGKVAATVDQDPAERRMRSVELWHDLKTGIAGVVFAAALLICMGSALGRRPVLCALTAAMAAVAALLFVLLSVRGERLRRGLDQLSSPGPAPVA